MSAYYSPGEGGFFQTIFGSGFSALGELVLPWRNPMRDELRPGGWMILEAS
jgi:hypothetical protein